jgi:hypothetical protein
VSKATLVVFGNKVTAAGSLDVYEVSGAWTEEAVTGLNTPACRDRPPKYQHRWDCEGK